MGSFKRKQSKLFKITTRLKNIMSVSKQYAVHADWLLGVNDSKPTIFRNRYVVIEGNEIVAITDTKPASSELVAEGGEMLIMHGFINLQNH